MRTNPFKRYFGFTKGTLLSFLAWRGEIIGWIIQSFLMSFVLIFLWLAIFVEKKLPDQSFNDVIINGFTYKEMCFYLIVILITTQWVGNSRSFETVLDDIKDGNISISLTKPISYRSRCYASTIGGMAGNFLLFALPELVIALLVFVFGFNLPWPHWYNIIYYLIIGMAAMTIIDSLDFIIAQTGFLTNSLFGIMVIKDSIISFLAGGMVPYSFFPKWLENTLKYSPFAFTASSPTQILLGYFSPLEGAIQVAIAIGWSIVLYLLSSFANHQMIKHCEAAGG